MTVLSYERKKERRRLKVQRIMLSKESFYLSTFLDHLSSTMNQLTTFNQSSDDGHTSRRYGGFPLNSTLVSYFTPDTIRSIISHAATGKPYSTYRTSLIVFNTIHLSFLFINSSDCSLDSNQSYWYSDQCSRSSNSSNSNTCVYSSWINSRYFYATND